MKLALSFTLIFSAFTLPPAAAEIEAAPADGTTFSLTSPLPPGGEFVCEVHIFYSWKPAPKALPDDKKANSKNPEPEPEPEPEQKPIEVFFTTIGERGKIGPDVKDRVLSRVEAAKGSALEQCNTEHRQSRCITHRMQAYGQDYRLLDFSSRRTLLSAVRTDCENSAGSCETTRASEPRCFLNRSPDASVEAPAGKDKKDEKKK